MTSARDDWPFDSGPPAAPVDPIGEHFDAWVRTMTVSTQQAVEGFVTVGEAWLRALHRR